MSFGIGLVTAAGIVWVDGWDALVLALVFALCAIGMVTQGDHSKTGVKR